jgi:hypothetical protein
MVAIQLYKRVTISRNTHCHKWGQIRKIRGMGKVGSSRLGQRIVYGRSGRGFGVWKFLVGSLRRFLREFSPGLNGKKLFRFVKGVSS